MGRRLHALVLVVVLVSAVAPTEPVAARGEDTPAWEQPVRAPLARPFAAPRSRFGAGHLGVDFAAAPGTPVEASGSGVVAFAGVVAGTRHVVIAHAGNLRTSYSFLASVSVRRGDDVVVGDVIGTAGGTGDGHDGSVVHLGLRSNDTYLDPMVLFQPIDLAEIVHLAPTSEPPRPQPSRNERRGLLDGLVHGARVAIRGAGRIGLTVGRVGGRQLAARFPLPAALAAGTADWIGQRRHCDAHAPAADGEGGSGHQVMLVAGIESSQDADHPSLELPAAALGYEPGEINYFSYASSHSYTEADTEKPLLRAAYLLAAQLRELQRREPGHEVDLLAHSQGGVVVEAFLTLIYERGDPSYPPLGTAVTLSAPLRGAPLAGAISRAAESDAVNALLGAFARRTGLPLRSAALRDLAPGSDLRNRLDAARLPDQVELTTIGAATDHIVPGNVSSRAGARGTTVLPHALNAHTAIIRDPSALRAVRAALENKPLPCQSLPTAIAGKTIPIVISALEERVAQAGQAVGQILDGGS